VLEENGQVHLLIHHAYPPNDLAAYRADIIRKLEDMGWKAMEVTLISSAAIIQNPEILQDGRMNLWMKNKDFRCWSDLEAVTQADIDQAAVINPQKRFLCKGGSFLIVAPSGVGKSTLIMQMAICWAAGRDFFGLAPKVPLRCFLLQGENDQGDVSEMARGITSGLALDPAEKLLLRRNFTMQTKLGLDAGKEFAGLMRELAELHKPDIIFVDPLFGFLKGDFNSQQFASEIFRQGIGPILKNTGCILVSTHHTPKPAKDSGRTGGMDFSYSGFGTSELTNWYRAVATLKPEKGLNKTFRFIIAKRGARADFPGGLNYCLIKHSQQYLFWEKVEHPAGNRVATANRTISKLEQAALTILKRIDLPEPADRSTILRKIMHDNGLRLRQAENYWAHIKDHFMKIDGKYVLIPPEEATNGSEPPSVESFKATIPKAQSSKS
jgi:hypothetical protein